jgi:hypothetical protein
MTHNFLYLLNKRIPSNQVSMFVSLSLSLCSDNILRLTSSYTAETRQFCVYFLYFFFRAREYVHVWSPTYNWMVYAAGVHVHAILYVKGFSTYNWMVYAASVHAHAYTYSRTLLFFSIVCTVASSRPTYMPVKRYLQHPAQTGFENM